MLPFHFNTACAHRDFCFEDLLLFKIIIIVLLLKCADIDCFSIKLFHGGVWTENPKRYNSGFVEYFDFCNVDEMSLLELFEMVKECGGFGCNELWYKDPGTDIEKGLFKLETDTDVMIMCSPLPKCKFVEIYSTCITLLSQENTQANSQQNTEQNTQDLRNVEVDLVDDQPVNGGKSDFEQSTHTNHTEDYDMVYGSDSGSDSDDTFYSDHSNLDESDDDLIFDVNVDKTISDEEDMLDNPDEGHESDNSTVYAGSDEEITVGNSTDDEQEDYPIFNEYVDMDIPEFKIGMCFVSSKVFRRAVRMYAIKERRPIINVKNYGRAVRYICQKPCNWQIMASPKGDTKTYQIKTFVKKHTCMHTFK